MSDKLEFFVVSLAIIIGILIIVSIVEGGFNWYEQQRFDRYQVDPTYEAYLCGDRENK